MLQVLTPNRALVFAVGAPIIYWLLAIWVPAHLLREVFNSLGFGAALIITITWGPSAWRAIKENAGSGEWQIILAIFVTWFVVLLQRCYTIIFNWAGRPIEWMDSPITGFWPFSYMIAGMLLLSAPGVTVAGYRSTAIWAMVAAASIGSLVAGILIGVNISTVF